MAREAKKDEATAAKLRRTNNNASQVIDEGPLVFITPSPIDPRLLGDD